MVSKQSPIVHVQAYEANRMYPRRQHAPRFEYGDILLMLLICFVMYGLFLYYFLPTAAPASYQRAIAELGYHWQAAWQSIQYSLAQVLLSFSHTTVLGEWIQYLTTLVTA